MNIKTLALTVTLTMSVITPAYADNGLAIELQTLCEVTGDNARQTAIVRDAGYSRKTVISLAKKSSKGDKGMSSFLITMANTIYDHPEVDQEAFYLHYKNGCIRGMKKLIGTDM